MSSSALPISDFSYFLPIAQTIIFAIFFVLFFNAIIIIVKRRLIAKAKNRRQTSNIQLFAKVLRYGVVVTVVIFGLIFYSGSWAG
ncbi:MAG: hypothetical protein COU27_01190, partial [Candidatus Levybacteria bacterium CG10_big_fil_rev_8_21_14_0_10_36_7]